MRNHRATCRRARQSVLLAVALFLASQAGMLAVVEGWWPALADPEFGVRIENLRTLRRQYPRRRSLVVLGSSRVGNGFNSDIATARSFLEEAADSPTVANMSMTAGTSVWQYLTLRRLIDDGLKPDAVIIEILPMTLVSDEQFFGSGYHFPRHRLRWGDVRALAAIIPEERCRHRREWLANNAVFPWHNHRFSLIGQFLPAWQVDQVGQSMPSLWRSIVSPTGWIRFGVDEPTPQQRREAEELAAKTYGGSGGRAAISGDATATYRAILSCCRGHGIEVKAVVMMPESEMFQGLYSPELQEEIGRFTESLSKDHGVAVVDARDWITAEKFWDGHHLLASGARLFTDRICTETLGFQGTAGGRMATRAAAAPR